MLVNRAKMTTATTGTGTITLGSAVDGYQTFAAAGVTDAAVVSYAIEDGTAWEIGTGTYTASGTTLSRTVTESSNAGAAINLTGNAVIFVTARAEDLATGGGAPTLATSSGATQSVDFSASNKIHVATIDEDATISFVNPAQVAKVDLILDVGAQGYDFSVMADSGKFFTTSVPDLRDIFFKPDGTKMYALSTYQSSTVPTEVYQYSLSTAWDVSTATYDNVKLNTKALIGVDILNVWGMFFKPDGTRLFLMENGAKLREFSLSTAWDLSSAAYVGVPFDAAAGNFLFVKPDGTSLYYVSTADDLYQANLSTAWDFSTATDSGVVFDLTAGGAPSGVSSGIFIREDGSELYVSSVNPAVIAVYPMTTPWDASTLSYGYSSAPLLAANSGPNGMYVRLNGDKTYISDQDETIYQYDTFSAPSVTFPGNLQKPSIPLDAETKTALQIVTYDGGTTYQAINVQGGIV